MKKKLFLGLLPLMAMALTACGGGNQPASQPEASSEQPQSSQPAPQESSEEPPADSSEEEDARGYDTLKSVGYEMKLGNRYYTLDTLEPDEAEVGHGMQGKYSLTEIDVVEGQEVQFYKDGESLAFFIDAEDDENKANTQERSGRSVPFAEGVHIRNDYVGAAIYFKVYSEANSIWITGYDSEYTPAPTETEYYVIGGFNGWAQKDKDYKMTKSADNENVYEFKNLELGKNVGLKCTDNGSELTWYGSASSTDKDKNYIITEDGIYTITLNLAPETEGEYISATKTGDWEAPAADYYVIGEFNNWNQEDRTYKMTVDAEDANHYTYAGLTVEGAVKVIGISVSDGKETKSWYGVSSVYEGCGYTDVSGDGNAIVSAGTYTVNFYLEAEGGNHLSFAVANAD